jgi:hypothetical protein
VYKKKEKQTIITIIIKLKSERVVPIERLCIL